MTALTKLPHTFVRTKNVMERVYLFLNGIHSGVWLGILSQKQLHELDEYYYNTWSMYTTTDHNTRGFFEWELPLIENYFKQANSILVAGAGGGREIYAGVKMGKDLQGFECNEHLRTFGNKMLKSKGMKVAMKPSMRDKVPGYKVKFEGVIVGWSAYMLIPGRDVRVHFLKRLATLIPSGAPLMMSFYLRKKKDFHLSVAWGVARSIQKLAGKKRPLEKGDFVDPNFTHFFTKPEIEQELKEAGFNLLHFSEEGGGVAIGQKA